MNKLSIETLSAGLRAALRIQEGQLPTDDEVRAAPLLSDWALEEVSPNLVRLVGFVSGHPLLPDGLCMTSVVLVIDTNRNWARTVSRLYRLTQPLGG